MQLEVDEHALAPLGELRRQGEAAAIGELHADLIEARRIADRRDQPFGVGDLGRVESDDQPVARLGRTHRRDHLARGRGSIRRTSRANSGSAKAPLRSAR